MPDSGSIDRWDRVYGERVSTRSVARNEAREAILEAAVDRLASAGPTGVHPQDLCEELGLSKALVNYHFGNRDGLIAEAMVVGYERYVDHLAESAAAAGPDPLDRLVAWVEAQIHWTAANTGLAAALNFPHHAAGVPDPMDPALAQRLHDAGARNLGVLIGLVGEVRAQLRPGRAGVVPGGSRPEAVIEAAVDATRQSAEAGRTPNEDELAASAMDAAIIGWTTLGMSVWVSGEHLPTRQLQVREFLPTAQQHFRDLIVAMLSR